ncbi:hypothetical protein GCM10011366_09420 [Ornithinimicrobium tianjinense]|uniref:Zinc-finger of transposase IS204/IS1001/IS1096/IS1165 n=1 Tax=Ornithinimicrobium tianjinense TaxID=1195761 RepID=A0A917BGH4_9MICO|nr:hypothetical protein GCM10011366_09420 [Ornithinimicrobium tianjinense]
MEVPTRSHPKDLDVPDATFTRPDLTTFTRLDGLGLEVTSQLLEPDRAVLACRVVEPDDWCRRCGCQGVPRDTVTRELAHEPFGWRPTTLLLTVRRYRCTECAHVWRQDTTAAAEPRAKISRAGLRWGLVGIVVQHLSMARVAEGLGVSWNTANDAASEQSTGDRGDGVRVVPDRDRGMQCCRHVVRAGVGRLRAVDRRPRGLERGDREPVVPEGRGLAPLGLLDAPQPVVAARGGQQVQPAAQVEHALDSRQLLRPAAPVRALRTGHATL